MRRPEQVKDEERGVAEVLLSSPVGTALQTIYSFLLEWYGLWTDDAGNRRTLDEAYTYYTAWRSNPDCQGLPALRRAQERVTEAKFERVSQFLRHPGWEATSNGMESFIRNHLFLDGNKRVALAMTGLFLERNGYVLRASNAEV